MADRYQDRRYAANHGRGGDQYQPDQAESDPLAELARLIGQTDPFAAAGPANAQVASRAAPRQDFHQGYHQDDQYAYQQGYAQDDYQPEAEPDEESGPSGPPAWIQRANLRRETVARQLAPEPQARVESHDYIDPVHAQQRYPAQSRQAQPDSYYEEEPYDDQQAYAVEGAELDSSRYDDALYGRIESSVQDLQRAPAYPDDPYAYQAGYEEQREEEPVQKRRSGMFGVAAILALAVVGTAAAYGYHTYFSARRSGEPPIIKADNSPTKIIPTPADGSSKLPDRFAQGDGTEKLVPREEQPLDVNNNVAGPRVVFPPLNPNANPPSVASITPNAMPPAPAPAAAPAATGKNGTFANSEPRKIKTFSVHGDQPDPDAVPVTAAAQPAAPAKQPPAARSAARTPATQEANASASMPLSLAPQARSAPQAETRVASTAPTEILPSAPAASGGYLVQVSSQRNESDAKASFRALQGKFPSVLGSRTPLIKRADLGSKGVYYRAMIGPFGTSEQAVQFCDNLKSAGGQCIIQRN
jgi:hypothetical protein